MDFKAFEQAMHGFLRGVEARGLGGQDAEVLAASLAERAALPGPPESPGRRGSTRRAVGNFRRGEARRRRNERAGARAAGWIRRSNPSHADAGDRRVFTDAIRETRQSLTAGEAADAAGSFLCGAKRFGPRPDRLLLRRAGDLLLGTLRRHPTFDMALVTDPRCARLLEAGMRMWVRGEA